MPGSFVFPDDVTLSIGWRKWWMGTVVIVGGQHYKIMPFRLLNVKDMPTNNLKTELKTKWRPILCKMTEGLEHATDYIPSESELKKSLSDAMDRLRDRFSFLFADGYGRNASRWKISTWSKRTQHAYVMKHGTDSDKEKLSAPTKRNQSHREKRYFTVQHKRPRKT